MKNIKYNKTLRVCLNIFLYISLVIVVIVSSVLISGWLVKRSNRKAMRDYNLYVETKKSQLVEKKISYVEALNKLESKKIKTKNERKQAKLDRKILKYKTQIENINCVLNTTNEQEAPQPKPNTKLDNFIETKLLDLKENVL